jgi:hypothetical protein
VNKNHDPRTGRFSSKGASGARATIAKSNRMIAWSAGRNNSSATAGYADVAVKHMKNRRDAIDRLSPPKASAARNADVKSALKDARANHGLGPGMRQAKMDASNAAFRAQMAKKSTFEPKGHETHALIKNASASNAISRERGRQVREAKAHLASVKAAGNNRVTHDGKELSIGVSKKTMEARAVLKDAKAAKLEKKAKSDRLWAKIQAARDAAAKGKQP